MIFAYYSFSRHFHFCCCYSFFSRFIFIATYKYIDNFTCKHHTGFFEWGGAEEPSIADWYVSSDCQFFDGLGLISFRHNQH